MADKSDELAKEAKGILDGLDEKESEQKEKKEKKEMAGDADIEKVKRSYTLPKSVVHKLEELNIETDKYNRSELVALAIKKFYEEYME